MQQNVTASHATGTTSAGNFPAQWILVGNEFAIIGATTTSSLAITSIFNFNFSELRTENFTYTKFKFVQE